ncbi:MAG: hypothetical protein KH020_20345 [Clostridiales bacterium]|nr:hypothetical protein [Clostridiales bacterium]
MELKRVYDFYNEVKKYHHLVENTPPEQDRKSTKEYETKILLLWNEPFFDKFVKEIRDRTMDKEKSKDISSLLVEFYTELWKFHKGFFETKKEVSYAEQLQKRFEEIYIKYQQYPIFRNLIFCVLEELETNLKEFLKE